MQRAMKTSGTSVVCYLNTSLSL